MHEADAEILSAFERTRGVTIALTEQIPETWLTRIPDGESAPLNHLLCHAGCGEAGWLRIFGDGGPGHVTPPSGIMSIVDAMEASRDRLLAFFRKDDGRAMGSMLSGSWSGEPGSEETWPGRERVLYLIAHEAHHRGRIILALRQWGFEAIPFVPF